MHFQRPRAPLPALPPLDGPHHVETVKVYSHKQWRRRNTMTSQRSDKPRIPDPMRAGAQPWETGRQVWVEGQHQAQGFWNSMARSWGEVTGAWLGQFSRSG